jgi:hypothetical protein
MPLYPKLLGDSGAPNFTGRLYAEGRYEGIAQAEQQPEPRRRAVQQAMCERVDPLCSVAIVECYCVGIRQIGIFEPAAIPLLLGKATYLARRRSSCRAKDLRGITSAPQLLAPRARYCAAIVKTSRLR